MIESFVRQSGTLSLEILIFHCMLKVGVERIRDQDVSCSQASKNIEEHLEIQPEGN